MSRNQKKVLVHGHRGSRGTHPENTLPAFQEAKAAGVDVLELDMHLTADDVVVITHEPMITGKLCRDANGKPVKKPVAIRSLKAADVAQYDCGNVKQERFPDQMLLAKTPMPTLEVLLEWRAKEAPEIWLNIETKMTAPKPTLVPDPKLFATKVIELLRKYHAVDRTILQSFDFRTLEAAKAIEPKLLLSCLFDDKEKDIVDRTVKVGAQVISPHFNLVTAEVMIQARAKNLQVVPWTLNTEVEWKKAVDLGVNAIISDYPRKLIQFLNAPVTEEK